MGHPLSKDLTGHPWVGTSGGSLFEDLMGEPLSKDLMGHPWAGISQGSLCNGLSGHHWVCIKTIICYLDRFVDLGSSVLSMMWLFCL